MKKTLTILSLFGFLFSNAVSAQTFVSQHTSDSDSSIESGSGVIKVKNYLKSSSATPVVLDWHVIDTSQNLSRSGTTWSLDGICDNSLCYSGAPLFTGSVNRSNPYADSVFDTFYALLNSDNAPVGSSAWVKVSAKDTATGGTTRTLTFIANKTPTGTSNITITDNDIHLYPNPAGKNIIISTGDYKGSLSLNITGMDGRQFMSGKIVDKVTTLAIGHLSPGMYLIAIRDENGAVVATKRFLHTQ